MDLFHFLFTLIFVTDVTVSAYNTLRHEDITQLFAYEKIQLRKDLLIPRNEDTTLTSWDATCKAFPGTSDWPSDDTWNTLNTTLNGALLRPVPLASVCYHNTTYNNYADSECATLSANWDSNLDRTETPIEVNSVMFEGLTCIPPASYNSNGCTQGGYPVYVVNVTDVSHVQAAVNFAREKKVRLVIKNTGHDLSGKSLGGGALSVWTHHLKDILYYGNYTTTGYNGPAFKVGAGVQGRDIYAVAYEKGMMVVGGVCDSVGLYGGYSQGGGHSMLSTLHGMGADQILSLQVVTADGEFLTASPTENTDLFWAIRGGGGSSFGIVTSMVVKAFKDVQTTVGTLEWGVQSKNISNETFWKGVSAYFSHFEELTNAGTAAEWNLYPKGSIFAPPDGQLSFQIAAFFGIGKTTEQMQNITAPWLADMKAAGINVAMNWTSYDSYHIAYQNSFPPTAAGLMPYAMGYASRLIPRENFDAEKKLNLTISAFRTLAEAGHDFNGYQYAPTAEAGAPVGPEGNAVHPSWREALSHTIMFVKWPDNATAEQQLQARYDFANDGMKPIRDAMPGAGSYLNEGDRLENNFQQVFYGANYPRLLKIKKKYDPDDVFWAVTAVGSEGWAVKSVEGLPTENGPLCRVEESS